MTYFETFSVPTADTLFLLIPDSLRTQPVFLCVDDAMVSKFGTKFENVSKLFDHAAHNGSNYLNGHCFVSAMLCVPVWNHDKVSYLSVPLGYRMWQKKESKLVYCITHIWPNGLSEFQSAALSSIDDATASPHSSALQIENSSCAIILKVNDTVH